MTRAALAILLVAGAAHADPLPVVERAGEANLEPDSPHSGVSLTAALVASSVISADASGDVGRGPGVSFRVGHAATRDTVITVELTFGSMLHEHESQLFTNNSSAFMIGAQYYAKPTLWIRGAAGIGSYIRRGLFDPMSGAPTADEHLFGPGALAGVGLDIMRRHKLVLGLEAFFSGITERHGITTVSGLGFSISYN